jgi:purine-nucleoside phosphorylase
VTDRSQVPRTGLENPGLKTIVNLGNPRKDMATIADDVLSTYSVDQLKLTGVETYRTNNIILTSPVYGAGMTLDALEEMKLNGSIGTGTSIVFVGSMGSLDEDKISLEDVVIPNPVGCTYYGYDGTWICQETNLLDSLKRSLTTSNVQFLEYKHGSSFAVFDPHTDHKTYTSSLYESDVSGVDCGEVFIGLQFAKENGMSGAAVLYCSDSPMAHIVDIGAKEFEKRAFEIDVRLNRIAVEVLK